MEIYWNREHNVDNCSIIKIIYLMIIKRIVHVFQLLSRESLNTPMVYVLTSLNSDLEQMNDVQLS